MNHALESALTRFDRMFGKPGDIDIELRRPAPDADESARAARNTFRLIRATMKGEG